MQGKGDTGSGKTRPDVTIEATVRGRRTAKPKAEAKPGEQSVGTTDGDADPATKAEAQEAGAQEAGAQKPKARETRTRATKARETKARSANAPKDTQEPTPKTATAEPKHSAETASSDSPDGGDKPAGADQPTSSGANPILRGHLSGLLPHAVTGIAAVVAVFLILGLLSLGGETTRAPLRALTGGAPAPASISDLRADLEAISPVVDRVGEAEARVAALGDDLETTSNTVDQLGDSVATLTGQSGDAESARQALSSRLDTLDARLGELRGVTEASNTSIDALRGDLDRAARTGASAEAVAARLDAEAGRIDRQGDRINEIDRAIASLRDAAASAPSPDGPSRSDLDAIASRLDALNARLGSLSGDVEVIDTRARRSALPALWLTFEALKAKAMRAEPFANELAALRAGLGSGPTLDVLAEHAAAPPQPVATLVAAAGAVTGDPVEPAQPAAAEGGFWDRLIDRAGSAVSVRRLDAPDETGSNDRGTTETRSLAALVDTVAALPSTPDRQQWLEAARARQVVDDALARLEQELTDQLATAGSR